MSEKIVVDPDITIDATTVNGNKSGLDGLNLEDLRLPQNFADEIGVKRALTVLPVRKPDRQAWIRVHPDAAYRMDTAVLELREARMVYLIAPHLVSAVTTEASIVTLVLAITRQGNLFLWPLKHQATEGRKSEWNSSARAAADLATRQWVRLASNMSAGAYDVFVAPGEIDDPAWPEAPFIDLVRLAFKHQYIESLEHPVLKQLRGE